MMMALPEDYDGPSCDSCGGVAQETPLGFICQTYGLRLQEVGPDGLLHPGPVGWWDWIKLVIFRMNGL